MGWDKVKSIISSAAPLLGGVLGGPFGAAAGELVSQALGVENTPTAIEEAVKNNPEALLKLKEIEAQNSAQLAELAYKTISVKEQSDTEKYLAMCSADGQSTRPKIALMMARLVCWSTGFMIIILSYGVYKEGLSALNIAIAGVFGIITAIPAEVLRKYFGELRKEQGQRLGIQPQGLIQKLFNRS